MYLRLFTILYRKHSPTCLASFLPCLWWLFWSFLERLALKLLFVLARDDFFSDFVLTFLDCVWLFLILIDFWCILHLYVLFLNVRHFMLSPIIIAAKAAIALMKIDLWLFRFFKVNALDCFITLLSLHLIF